MYRVLIVDDERIARESVRSQLAVQEGLELEIVTASSAVEAVSILQTDRIDIAVVDINMPQMTGMELYEIVRENWPQCKVIFLTGYSEFDYVYKVHKHARYVLKADREEVLLEAVRESIREIEEAMVIARSSLADLKHVRHGENLRASEFINELLEGYTNVRAVTDEILQGMGVPLSVHEKTYAILLRCEAIAESDFDRRQLINEQIYLLLERYFQQEMGCAITTYKKVYFFLLLQPKIKLVEEAVVRRLGNICSLFQNALQLNAQASTAILIPDRAMSFREAIRSFAMFYDGVAGVETGDTQFFSQEAPRENGGLSSQCKMHALRAAIKLDHLFEAGNRAEIIAIIRQIREAVQGVEGMHDIFLLELYFRIAAELLKSIKQHEVSAEMEFRMGVMEIYNLSSYKSWEHAFSYLEDVTDRFFEMQEKSRSEQEESLVTRIKNYISLHIQNNTSLTAIADHFHFSPDYLSKLFKKEEGVTIFQYTNDVKLMRAKELLEDKNLQVQDIAEMLGFSNTGYFIKFFRAKTGLSPRAYREDNMEE